MLLAPPHVIKERQKLQERNLFPHSIFTWMLIDKDFQIKLNIHNILTINSIIPSSHLRHMPQCLLSLSLIAKCSFMAGTLSSFCWKSIKNGILPQLSPHTIYGFGNALFALERIKMYFLIDAPYPDNIGKLIYVVMNGFWFVLLSVAAEGYIPKGRLKRAP